MHWIPVSKENDGFHGMSLTEINQYKQPQILSKGTIRIINNTTTTKVK